MNLTRGQYSISTDAERLDVDAVHAYLTRSFWATGISRELVATSMANSLCFGLFDDGNRGPAEAGHYVLTRTRLDLSSARPEGIRGTQVGFARVVTDRATYGYLCDVYVLESHRGLGLGKWLIEAVMAHDDLQGLRRFQLVTRDAHSLYARHGFAALTHPDRHMEIFRDGLYIKDQAQDQ